MVPRLIGQSGHPRNECAGGGLPGKGQPETIKMAPPKQKKTHFGRDLSRVGTCGQPESPIRSGFSRRHVWNVANQLTTGGFSLPVRFGCSCETTGRNDQYGCLSVWENGKLHLIKICQRIWNDLWARWMLGLVQCKLVGDGFPLIYKTAKAHFLWARERWGGCNIFIGIEDNVFDTF